MSAASNDYGSLPLRSPLVGIEAVGGLLASRATPLVVFVSISTTPSYLASLEGLSRERGALAGLSLPMSATSEVGSALKLAEPDVQMAEG